MPGIYDLMNELGPENYYDKLCAEAYLLGEESKDIELLWLAEGLAQLIHEIPYDHDHFYKVDVKAQEVELRIKEIKRAREEGREIGTLAENPNSSSGWRYTFRTCKPPETGMPGYCIQLVNWRFRPRPHEPTGPTTRDVIKGFLEKITTAEVASHERESYGFRGAKEGTHTMQTAEHRYNGKGQVVATNVYRAHEDGNSVGLVDIYFFYNLTDAREAWKKVNELFAENQPPTMRVGDRIVGVAKRILKF